MNLEPEPDTDILEAGPSGEPASAWWAAASRWAVLPVSVAVLSWSIIVSAAPPADPGSPSAQARPRLVAPAQAHPGEQLTVMAYRNRRLCGPAQLRLDGSAARHAVVRELGPVGADWTALIMTVDIPRPVRLGQHVIQLHGPMAGGRGPVCAEGPEHQGQIAETAIAIR